MKRLVARARALVSHRELAWQLIKREIIGRYKGSVLGVFWSLVQPLFLLAVYTFVFSVVFSVRVGDVDPHAPPFVLRLFTGLIIFSLFSETLNAAPRLVVNKANFVKKLRFPLEILPIVGLGAALFHVLVSVMVLLLIALYAGNGIAPTVLLFPLVLAPFCLVILGMSWLLASIGVYFRDVSQTIGLATTALLFLSPVFYSPSALPEAVRPYIYLNPLTLIIEQSRNVLLRGVAPEWSVLLVYTVFAALIAWLGFVWFRRTRGGFADVL